MSDFIDKPSVSDLMPTTVKTLSGLLNADLFMVTIDVGQENKVSLKHQTNKILANRSR